MWADPRLLERWWGPPDYPATVTAHDLAPGGLVRYYMTGPDGEQFHGGFQVTTADPPATLAVRDYFADAEGNPDPAMPTSETRVDISTGSDGRTVMTLVTTFPSAEAMEQFAELGAVEGMTAALGQIDELLTA